MSAEYLQELFGLDGQVAVVIGGKSDFPGNIVHLDSSRADAESVNTAFIRVTLLGNKFPVCQGLMFNFGPGRAL